MTGEIRSTREKMPFCAPHIPKELPCHGTRVSRLMKWRITVENGALVLTLTAYETKLVLVIYVPYFISQNRLTRVLLSCPCADFK